MSMSYEQALLRYRRQGAARADDTAMLAGFCATVLQSVAGAVSPQLVYEGAQAKGMSCRELAALAVADPWAVSELQWVQEAT